MSTAITPAIPAIFPAIWPGITLTTSALIISPPGGRRKRSSTAVPVRAEPAAVEQLAGRRRCANRVVADRGFVREDHAEGRRLHEDLKSLLFPAKGLLDALLIHLGFQGRQFFLNVFYRRQIRILFGKLASQFKIFGSQV